MGKEQRYQNAASQLLRLVGGKENVISAAHCATRLRLVLKDESKADVDGILKTELIKGQFSTGGQFQIIIGSGTVDEVYKYFIQYADIKESSKNEVKKDADQKMNPLQKLVKMLADVFVPIIPALVASGLLMGLNNVLTAEGLFISGKSLVEAYPNISDLASMINTFASAAYAFLPILVGFSATKMFGGNPTRIGSNKDVRRKSISRSCYGNDHGIRRSSECVFLWYSNHSGNGSGMAHRSSDDRKGWISGNCPSSTCSSCHPGIH